MTRVDSYDTAAMTKEFMHRFFAGDVEWCAAALAPDAVIIGAQSNQFMANVQTMLNVAEQLPKVVFLDETYGQITKCGDMRVVCGRFVAYIAPGSGRDDEAFAAEQRVTAIWFESSEGMRIIHLHVSNPMVGPGKQESFPDVVANQAMWYINLLTEQKHFRARVDLQDSDGVHHVLRLFDIVMLEAKLRDTLIHEANAVLHVRDGIGSVVRRLGLDAEHGFVQVHRSFWVNVLYVKEIQKDCIMMVTGHEIPISVRRRAEIAESIRKVRGGYDSSL